MRRSLCLVILGGACAVACSQRPEVAARLAAQGGPLPGESFWDERTLPVPDGGVDPNPPGRRATALAYDPGRDVAVLYGGRNEEATPILNDTWEWSSFTRTWQKEPTSGSPGRRYGHTMVWFGDRIVLFGGRNENDELSDETWVYTVTPRTWTKLNFDAAHRPPARYEHAMAVASAGALDGIVIQGGFAPGAATETLDDTWLLANLETGWVNVTHSDKPPARGRHAMTWDDSANRLVLFGGDTDTTSGGEFSDTWTSMTVAGVTGPLVRWVKHGDGTPSARARARLVWYDTFGVGVLNGGGQTWQWDAGWMQDSPDGTPGSLAGHAMAFDDSRKLVLLFGGSPAVNRTWEYRIDNRPSIEAPDGAGDEGDLLELDIVGSDAIDDAQLLTLSLTDVDPTPDVPVVMPAVMGTGEVTGHLTWTPSCNDHGAYTLSFSLTDGVHSETAESTVTIADVNCLPVFADIGPQTFEEGEAGGFTVSATDPENGKVTLGLDPVTMPRTPDVAPSFNSTTGMVTWTPGPSDSGSYTFTFRATDPGGATARKDVTVTVGDVDSPPVLELPAAQTIAEGAMGSFMVSASDPDGGEVTVTFVDLLPAPEVAPSFTVGSAGIFTWTPGFLDDGVYTATFRASDGGAPVEGTVSITVTDSNRPPSVILNPAGLMKMTSEGRELRFTVAALDPDADDQLSLTAPSLPQGALFDGAVFTWTPDSTRGSTGGTPYMAVFAVSDGSATVMTAVTITVFDVNQPPVVTPIPPKTIAEGGTLSFTVSATDPDGGTVRFSARALPPGASFDATTRTFTWSPGCTAADTSPMTSARLVASDDIDEVEIVVPITVTGTVVLASPASLSFPSTRVGASASPLALSVMNGASQPLRVLSMSSGASVFPLSVTGALPRTLAADEAIFAQVGFLPVAQTVSASAITITVEDPACPTVTVPVTGAGQASGLSVSRSGADFGPVRVGGLSPPVSFTVTNVGEASFTVQSVTLTGDDFVLALVSPAASGYPVLVPMDGIVSFTVTGAPGALGLRTGSIAIATDIPGAPLTSLPLSVVGVTPDLSVTPSEIAFGAVDIRGAAATRELVLSNTGQVAISVARPTVTGPGASAYRVLGGAATTVLAPGETASFTVSYTPAAESSGEAAASVQVAIGSLSIGVPLSGRGADRHLGTPDAPVIFARTRVGDQRTQVVTLRNTGEAPLLLEDVHTDGCADFSDDVASAATVPALGTREVTVRFQPTATGARACDLVVESDDAARPVARIALEGTGGGGLALAPATLQAGAVPVGTSKVLMLAVSNDGGAAVRVERACVRHEGESDCATDHVFTLEGWQDGTEIAGGGSRMVRVRFAPDEARAYQADVLFFVAGQTLPDEVPVSGTGSDDILLTGGGCGVGGGSAGWPAALLVVGLLLLRRRAAFVLLLAAAPASADPGTSFDLGVFRPGLPESSVITVERPDVLPPGSLGVALTVDYAKNPLLARRTGDTMADALVADRVASTLVAGYGLAGGIELGAALPFIVAGGQSDMTGAPVPDGAALGDLVLGARVRLARPLAVGAELSLPTGDDAAYAGAAGFGAALRASTGMELGRLALAASAGLTLRFAEARMASVRQTHEIDAGAGAALRLGGSIEALGEIYGALGLGAGEVSPVEAALGLRAWSGGSLAFTSGAALGLHHGVGASDVRIFLGVAWAPRARLRPARTVESEEVAEQLPPEPAPPRAAPRAVDTDGDGVLDGADLCPDGAEDRDGWQDDDGCDDPDNDRDGIADVIDSCTLQAEVINGNKDDDGCPDRGEPALLLSADRLELLAPIRFQGAAIRPASHTVLDQIAATLRAHPEIRKLVIHVHVRGRGDPDGEEKLARRRGEALLGYLERRGVEAGRLEARAHGSRNPLGRAALDERVELTLE